MEIQGKDGLILNRLQQGDEQAFRILFEEFYTPLCLFATRYLGGEEATDVVQEVFLKYWDRHIDFDNYFKIKSFLYMVTRNICLNQLRSKRIRVEITENVAIESDEFFREQVMEEEAYRIFYRSIEELPQQMRSVIHYALEGLKNSEIAEKMGVSDHAVHAYKKEAYKRLKIRMKDHYYLLQIIFCVLF